MAADLYGGHSLDALAAVAVAVAATLLAVAALVFLFGPAHDRRWSRTRRAVEAASSPTPFREARGGACGRLLCRATWLHTHERPGQHRHRSGRTSDG